VVFKYMPEDIMYARHEDDNVWEEDNDKWNRTWCRYDKRPSIW
jgi:hypothetical protein